ncbi:MAG: DUF721 domain-containing protein [Burkholderiales bacterium]|nr:DUF721 domain-containing protein [Burkholderiales bacterium]
MIFANKLDFFLNQEALLIEAERTLAIEKILRASLPQELAKYCSMGRLSAGRLHIYADNGAVALKLRQFSSGIVEKLKARGVDADSLKISVRVKTDKKPAKTPKPKMGKKGIESFRELANSLEDSPLKSSIESLLESLGKR